LNNSSNIILLTIDCWRFDYFGDRDDRPSPTPNIDALASQALVFRQTITGGGWTRPSLTALFSSTPASLYGGALDAIAPERPLLSELLQDAGYLTAGFTTNPQVGRLFGFERGFHVFEECTPDGEYSGPRWAYKKGVQRLLKMASTHQVLRAAGMRSSPPEITTPASQLTQKLSSWLAVTHDRPFFAWAHFMDAHWPYHVLRQEHTPQETARMWQDINLMSRVAEQHGWLNPGQGVIERLRCLYRQAISYIDESIGQLFSDLKKQGLWENTVVILTSDHGEEFYEHGRWGHFQLYDECVRVPLIVRTPGSTGGRLVENQVSLLDIAPTILGLAGYQIPGEMYGLNLIDCLNGGEFPKREVTVESMWPDNYRMAIRTEEYKYIYEEKLPLESQLYDLQADPREKRNIFHEHSTAARMFEDHRKELALQAQATAPAPVESISIDPDLAERLKALGYVE
jgi:arylsulfatase A-like enzyme